GGPSRRPASRSRGCPGGLAVLRDCLSRRNPSIIPPSSVNIVQITPGAGGMFCGGCFRDNALVAALRKRDQNVLMVPLYLPLTLDEQDQTAGTPTFYNGINVYLEQKSKLFRKAPKWVHRLAGSPRILKLLSKRAVKTRPADVGDLTLSMLQGENGY